MDKDEQILALAGEVLDQAGHKNVTVKRTGWGDAADIGVKAGYESVGTWEVSSDLGSFSFSLTVDDYNHSSKERIATIVMRCSREAAN